MCVQHTLHLLSGSCSPDKQALTFSAFATITDNCIISDDVALVLTLLRGHDLSTDLLLTVLFLTHCLKL